MKLKVKNIFLEILLKGNKCKKRPTPVVWANSLVVTHLEGVEDGGYVDVAETGEVRAADMKTKKMDVCCNEGLSIVAGLNPILHTWIMDS
jgi:hypothetical protein